MKYGSVCSGIEAASVAWESLGWQAQWYSEIEHFPSAVLAHRFPTVPNLGDMTQIHLTETFNGNSIDLLVGGTPCQSFSVAGLRKGLDDPRGQLMYTFVELAARKRPKWVVWENVPGVLSSNKGADFASFLGLLTGRDIQAPVGGWTNSGCIEGISSAYGVAWTMLDAQDFGVAQRRKRIFAIGYLGDWRPAAAVLFESYRLSGDIKEGRKKRKATSSDAQGSVGGGGIPRVSGSLDTECGGGKLTHQSRNNGHLIPDKSKCVIARQSQAYDPETETMIPSWWNGEQTAATLTKMNANGAQRMPDKDNSGAVLEPTKWISPDGNETVGTLRARDYKGIGNDDLTQGRGLAVAHAFKVRGGSETETGEQGGTPGKKAGKGYLGQDEKAFTIGTTQDQQIAQPVPFRKAKRAQSKDDHETWEQDEKTNTLNAFDVGDIRTTQAVVQPLAVDLYNGTIQGQITCTLTSEMGVAGHSGPKLLQPIAVDTYNQTINEHTTQTIRTQSHSDQIGAVLTPQAVDFRNQNLSDDVTGTLQSKSNGGYSLNYQPGIIQPTMAIRRLLPTECEILQGFPRNWTLIPYRGKTAEQCPDGPRYKACGNSMAVPVMRWIGQRIQIVEDIINNKAI